MGCKPSIFGMLPGRAAWAAWLLSTGIAVGSTALSQAQTPAARLLPPQPVSNPTIVSRGSSAEPEPSGAEEPSPGPALNPPEGKLPPPYSSQRNKSFPVLSSAWKKVVKQFDDTPQGANPVTPPKAVGPTTPAWNWYGYGAPVLSRNPYAPQGNYAVVTETWYQQSGATPGAMPKPAGNGTRPLPVPEAPAFVRNPPLPEMRHQDPEPPLRENMILPPREASPATLETPQPPLSKVPSIDPLPAGDLILPADALPPGRPGATFDGGVRPVTHPETKPGLILPEGYTPDPKPPSVSRGQSPERSKVQPTGLSAVVRSVCDDRVVGIEVLEAGPKALVVRIQVRRMADAQAVVNRIARLKELSGFHVVYEAGTK